MMLILGLIGACVFGILGVVLLSFAIFATYSCIAERDFEGYHIIVLLFILALTSLFAALNIPVQESGYSIYSPELTIKTNGVSVVVYTNNNGYCIFTSKDTDFYLSSNIVIKSMYDLDIFRRNAGNRYEVLSAPPSVEK